MREVKGGAGAGMGGRGRVPPAAAYAWQQTSVSLSGGGSSEVSRPVGIGSWMEKRVQTGADAADSALDEKEAGRRGARALHLIWAFSVTSGGITGLYRFVPDSPHKARPCGAGTGEHGGALGGGSLIPTKTVWQDSERHPLEALLLT